MNEEKMKTAAEVLYERVMAGKLVGVNVDGRDCSLWLQADEFVMVKQGSGANQRHQLCVGETGPDRLLAHWYGFCMGGQ